MEAANCLGLSRSVSVTKNVELHGSELKERVVSLPTFNVDTSDAEFHEMARSAREAADFLKALGHEGRIMILCHLATGEKSVTELEYLLSARQAAVSQQLMRLRQEKLVQARREGKQIFYSLADDRALQIMNVIYDLFCKKGRTGRGLINTIGEP